MSDEQKKMFYIKDENGLNIKATSPKGNVIESATVEALLLFDIRYELQQLNSNVIDVETAVKQNRD